MNKSIIAETFVIIRKTAIDNFDFTKVALNKNTDSVQPYKTDILKSVIVINSKRKNVVRTICCSL